MATLVREWPEIMIVLAAVQWAAFVGVAGAFAAPARARLWPLLFVAAMLALGAALGGAIAAQDPFSPVR